VSTEMAGAAAPGEIREQWLRVREMLRAEFGDTAFRTWLKPLDLGGFDHDKVVITVPTQFIRDWIVTHYADRIRSLWTSVNPRVRTIALLVQPSRPRPVPALDRAPQAPERSAADGGAPRGELWAEGERETLDELGARLDPRFTFETFVVGKPNEFAVAAAERVAMSDSPPFNPLFLHGGVGLGKTHLMHAIGWRIRQRAPAKRVVYLSAEKFMYQFVRALRQKDVMSFKELFRSVDVLMVDDVQFICGKESTQEEFFHTFNALVDRGRQIVISADRSPADLSGLEERIRSRLGWGLVADIHPTTYELRLGILESKAERLGCEVPRPVLEFLARHITSNVRELEGALNRVVHHTRLFGAPMTVELCREILRDLLRAHERRVTIDEIQRAVAHHFGLKLSDMSSSRRARPVARPRQIAMYLCKQLTTRSLPEIGRKFGGRDHTTVLHAIRQIERLKEEDPQLAQDLELLVRQLRG